MKVLTGTTGSSSITHSWVDGKLKACSTAVDMMHNWADGSPPSLTGFGFCEHYQDEHGCDLVVEVGPWPPVDPWPPVMRSFQFPPTSEREV